MARTNHRTRLARAVELLAAVSCLAVTLGLAGCEEGLLGPGDGPPPIPATAELLDGRVYAAPNSYVLGKHLADGTEVNLAFDGTQITASAGCRTAKASFQIRNGRLRTPGLIFEGVPCSAELLKQERWLTKLLRGPLPAELASEEAGVLYLGNRQVSLEMGALEMDEPDQGRLRSDMWKLRRLTIENGESDQDNFEAPGLDEYNKTTPFATTVPELSMLEGDEFYIYADCGLVEGTFSFDEASIEFDPNETTSEECGPRRKQFFDKVAPLFDGSFEYRFDGPDLILTQGDTTLRFFSG